MATVEVKQGTSTLCPVCRTKSKKVPSETVPALVKPELRSAVCEEPYRFCESPACDVVYFSEADPQHQFKRSDLRVRVGQKETEPDRHVCYCFDWTAEDIERELRSTGKTTIHDRIRRKVQEGFCHCETMNPQGSCCLGNVSKAVKEAEQKLKRSTHGPAALVSDAGADSCRLPGDPLAPARSKTQRGQRGAVLASVGAVFSAVVASACCWLPLVLLAMGISGVGVAGIFEQYRPIFLTGTFALLGVAWYLTYRPTVHRWLARSSTASAAGSGALHACCAVEPEQHEPVAAESCCATDAGGRRFSIRQFNIGMLWVSTAVALVFAFFPHWIGYVLRAGSTNNHQSAVTLKQYEVRIEGMTCEGCATTLEKSIRQVPGVKEVHVSYRDGLATIGVDSTEELTTVETLRAIEKAGYRGRFAEPVSGSSP